MSKKMILTGTALVLIFATALPVYAQSTTQQTNPGFMSEISNILLSLFHHQTATSGQTQTQSMPNMPVPTGQTGQTVPSGSMQPAPSGTSGSGYLSMQQRRLSFLVQQGKITQAQEQAILTELTTVQNELTNWAQSQGINPDYVIGSPTIGDFTPGGPRVSPMIYNSNKSQGFSSHPMMQGGQGFQGGGVQNGQQQQQGQ